jgi:hypothetical protein
MIEALLLTALLAQVKHPCNPCHAQIVTSYGQTAMARTSGRVISAAHVPSTPFLEPKTATTFSVDADLNLHYSKGADVAGVRKLDWFIGSGRVGRSYLFGLDQRLFQSPVSYYSEAKRWQLSPGFDKRPALDLTRAVEPSCLNCHSSRFDASSLTIEPGISCERCHGDTSRHVASAGKVSALNPRKLGTEERDSVCAQCHLTGAARVAKYQSVERSYAPGLKLSNFSAVFTLEATSAGGAIGVTSHFEKMMKSQCKMATGESFTCTTCHDPHSEPKDASAFFNPRCQSCHASKPCVKQPQGNCIECHMPKASGRGVDHSSYTDHSIPRKQSAAAAVSGSELKNFWGGVTEPRDLGMAYAALQRMEEAQGLLEAAAKKNPKDLAVLSQLAQIYDRQGKEDAAGPLYEAVLKLDSRHASSNANLGVIRVKQGQVDAAIALWRSSLRANPAQTGVRMNLAQALLRQGDRTAARAEIELALKYDPDQPNVRRLLQQLPR